MNVKQDTFDALVSECFFGKDATAFYKDGAVFYPRHDGSTFRVYKTIAASTQGGRMKDRAAFWLDVAMVAVMGSIVGSEIDLLWRQEGSWLTAITLVLSVIIGALAAQRLWQRTSA